MTNNEYSQFVPSVLNIKSTARDNEIIENELNLPEGKSIAQLLYEEKEKNTQKENGSRDQEA
jgi:hypothetical protein